jgi:RsmE family RNA methyltransferase
VNLLLFSDADRDDAGRVRITGPRLAHLREVLDSQPGESLRVGEIGGLAGQGAVESISDREAVLSVTLTTPPPAKLPLVLLLALPRPKQLRRILRSVAELGIAELHLLNSYRVEKSYWQTPALEPHGVQRSFLDGLSQARDTVLPTLHLHRRFKPFVEDQLPGMLAGKRALVAHPGDHPTAERQPGATTLIAIGPEGGFIPYEVEKLREAGCAPCSLGPRILRVENAVTAAASRLC